MDDTAASCRADARVLTLLSGKIYNYLVNDHLRLDEALRRATHNPDVIDMSAYAEFREGLLRHIGMEQKILFRATLIRNGGEPIASAARLHLDHGALAALLVLTPTPAIISALRTILDRHNPIEEGPGGAYEECERLLGPNADQVLIRLQQAPPVPVAKYVNSSIAFESARNALQRAGYDFQLRRS